MKKKIWILALALSTPWIAASPAWATTSATAPCDPGCSTCQHAINTFQEQAQQTLAVAKPPNPQNAINSDTCLGTALNFSLSSMFSSNVSGLIQQLEHQIYQAVCSAAQNAISQTVSDGNSLLNFNLPSSEFTQLTGMSSFTPVTISSNPANSSSVTFQNSNNGNLWNNIASNATSTATGAASNQVSNWYNNVLP
ncbi:hypothetical protein RIE95_05390 [Acidithiobacillus thiooxidans]|uniref:hypothetical protein n=1 Tax=Acidithiobacillus thiooxidans TaxID=930 RepID=UPI0028568B85|nr:hypothetical protein [Acidithiobacillus thiooxidans]MDR7926428.1 hypothetical protein [Acidithiobacillus thiooxidans]